MSSGSAITVCIPAYRTGSHIRRTIKSLRCQRFRDFQVLIAIEDPGSRLHERYEVGVWSHGNYHSVDTGKYTLAPAIAHETAKRILNK